MYNLKLLCTSITSKKVDETLDYIEDNFVDIEKIFIFYDRDHTNTYYLTFNIDTTKNGIYENFISIHRKKEYNTLYSVNALNLIIRNLNNGILDTKYKLDWSLYRNVLLLSKGNDIRRIPLVLEEIIKY